MAIVINKQLAKVSQELGFSNYIVLDNDQVTYVFRNTYYLSSCFYFGQEKYLTEKVLADVVESFIAALYIDKGLEYAETFCEICLFPKLFVSYLQLAKMTNVNNLLPSLIN